jgi:hypothetical protein
MLNLHFSLLRLGGKPTVDASQMPPRCLLATEVFPRSPKSKLFGVSRRGHIYIYIYMYMYTCMYIYIHRHRRRDTHALRHSHMI